MQTRFITLDGVRGLAAVMVMALHLQMILGGPFFAHGYLMVDLFFLMSGFVLSAGYGARLAQPGAGPGFARARLIRLYPLALVGLALGSAVQAYGAARGVMHPPPQWALIGGLSVLFLPWLGGGLIVPFNGPIWSLQLELWINGLYGAVAPRLTDLRLWGLIAACGVGLTGVSLWLGQFDGGFANHDPSRHAGDFAYLIGWLRVGFSFPLGVALHRLWRAGRLRIAAPGSLGWLVPATVGLIAFIPVVASPLFDLGVVGAAFPLLLVCAAQAEPSKAARLYARAGRLSYGLYVIHGPVVVFFHTLEPAGASLAVRLCLVTAAAGVSIGAAWAAERWIDAPARRWAAGPTRERRSAAVAASA